MFQKVLTFLIINLYVGLSVAGNAETCAFRTPVFVSPSTSSKALISLPRGSEVTLRKNLDIFYDDIIFKKVTTRDGIVGYIKSNHLHDLKDSNGRCDKISPDETNYLKRMNSELLTKEKRFSLDMYAMGWNPNAITSPTTNQISIQSQSYFKGFGLSFFKDIKGLKKNIYSFGLEINFLSQKNIFIDQVDIQTKEENLTLRISPSFKINTGNIFGIRSELSFGLMLSYDDLRIEQNDLTTGYATFSPGFHLKNSLFIPSFIPNLEYLFGLSVGSSLLKLQRKNNLSLIGISNQSSLTNPYQFYTSLIIGLRFID
tara:strand:+ start:273 stop:1214 length:942 start_codon:yes stop_codon:yes gene_type:complete